jgi:predicted HD superfamily hydrolase involved in NAD metabolism
LRVVDRYLPFLEQVLTPKRLQHSLGVMQVMSELAGVYDLDQDTALAAGLLHDAAKDLDEARYMTLVEEAGIEMRCPCEADYNDYLHGPVGAYFVYQELGIVDRPILDAIATHTYYGGPNFDVDAFNARAVERFRGLDEPAVVQAFETARQAWLDLVARLPDDALRNKKIADRLHIEIIGHLAEHAIP